MNPADAAQGAQIAHDMSLWGLFWSAHVVKLVMLGLLAASVWCWADHRRQDAAVRPHQQRDGRLRGGVLVGPVAGGALPVAVRGARPPGSARSSSPPCASGSAPSRGRAGRSRASRSASTRCWTSPSSARSSGSKSRLLFLASIGSAGPFIGLFGTVWGIMTSFTLDRRLEEHQPRGRRARHRRGAVRHRDRPVRRDPGGDRLQQAPGRGRQDTVAARSLRGRVLGHPVAPDRRAHRGSRLRESRAMADRIRRTGPRHGGAAPPPARTASAGAINEINMTPFIDVMLVLLDHLHGGGAR